MTHSLINAVTRSLPFWYPPILVYHRITSDGDSSTPTLSPENFSRQMELLARHWRPTSLARLAGSLVQGSPPDGKAVAVTFDDGTEDLYHHAFPVLKKYRIPAMVFLIVDQIGKPTFLNRQQIQEMAEEEIQFGSHTLSHCYLPEADSEKAQSEIQESKQQLEQQGIGSDFISFPAGGFTAEILNLAQKAGYKGACTTNRGFQRVPANPWALRRISMHGSASSRIGIWLRCCGFYGFNRRLRSPS